MATVKLSQAMRDRLVNEALHFTFKKAEEALIKRREALADRVYDHQFTPEELKLLKKIPAKWLPSTGSARFSIPGRGNVSMEFGKGRFYPVPEFLQYHNFTVTDAQLISDITDYVDDDSRFRTDRAALKTQISAVFGSVNTLKALLQVWPEAKNFVPKEWNEKVISTLPAVVIDGLNTKIAALSGKKLAA